MRCPSCGHANQDGQKFCGECGRPLVARERPSEPPKPAVAVPASIAAGRYQVKRFLGEGAKKRVYLVHDTRLERDVAVAVLKTERIDETSLARIRLEARAMARLGDHPRIVTVHDIGEDEGTPYIVSQYMAGGTIESLLEHAADHRLPIPQALRIADQVCQALEHTHGRGIIHRDLKPANVWLTDDGFAKLGDFGLAATPDRSKLTREGSMLGTVAYMSPEQALGKPVDARSDLYSLGGMLYEMVTGRPPFLGDDAVAVISQHLNAQPVSPSRYNAEIPQALDAVVLRLLAKDHTERPENADTVRRALKAIPAEMPASVPATHPAAFDSLPGGIFVGRKEEIEQLRAGLEDAIAGRGRLFMLVGEPGIGKTRTAEQLATYARLRHAQVLVGRCHEGEGAPAYWPWVQIIRSFVRERRSLDLASDMGPGAAEIAQVVPEVREKLPDLPPVQSTDPEGARFRLFDAIATFLKNAAKGDPLVLVLDDLHWADKSSLLLLQFLAREMAESRLLVLGTYRDIEVQRGHPLAEVVTAIRRERVYERILLRGLPEPDVRVLLTALGGQEVPEAFARAIFRETEGNPFFIEEILQHLIEESIIYREGGRWTSKLRAEEMGIPESVRDVVGRRLNRLSKECNELLTTASVVGREFGLEALAGASGLGRDEVLAALDPALEARVIAEVPRRPGRFSFSHALVRETLYGELRSAQRLKLHQRIAEVLERLHAENPTDHLAELAHHFLEAATGGGDAEKAVKYAQRAGARADEQLAYAEAVAHYERALQALDLKRPLDEQPRSELLFALGESCWKAGEFDKAREAFRMVARIAREQTDADLLAGAALGFGGPFSNFNVVALEEELISLLREALEVFPEGDSLVRARLLARLAGALHHTESKPKLVLLARGAIDMARRTGDRATLSYVLNHVRYPLSEPSSLDERLEITTELIRLAEDAGDAAMALDARYYRMSDLVEGADLAAARRELDTMARLAEQVRQPHPLWRFKVSQVAWAIAEGRLEDADTLAAEALELRGGAADQTAAGVFVTQCLLVRREQDRISEIAPRFIVAAQQSPHFYGLQCCAGWVHAEAGGFVEAQAALDRLVPETSAEWRHDVFSLASMFFFARVCAAVGDKRRAAVLYEIALPYADHLIGMAGAGWVGSMQRVLGVFAATLANYDDAEQHFERALRADRSMPLWLGWTQHDYAAMLLSRAAPGDLESARSLLNAAIALASEKRLKLLLDRSLALKMKAEGTAAIDVKTSIDAVANSIETKRPDLRPHAAPDGTVTIMFSDMEGFSTMTERLGDREAHKVVQVHNRIVREQVKGHGGYEVELQGDGFLLAFASASRALQCASSIQRAFSGYSVEHPEQPIRVRIGLHTGEPIKEADRFFGKTVILAARIASEAQGEEIFVSALVKELTSGASDFIFDGGQEVELKGLAGTHGVYELLWDGREPRRKASPRARLGSADSVFLREGDYWTLAYDGKSVRLRDMKGLHCIAHLLRHPGQEFHVADLASVGEAGAEAPAPAGRIETTDAERVAGLGDAGEVLDPQARAQYKERLESLRAELEEAKSFNDPGRAERIQEEIDFIGQELSSAYGIGGRARKAADATERIRKAVTARIRESLGKIQKEHPELAQHFSRAIRTGTFCSYNPEKNVSWQL